MMRSSDQVLLLLGIERSSERDEKKVDEVASSKVCTLVLLSSCNRISERAKGRVRDYYVDTH
jgi:hypothetical protein